MGGEHMGDLDQLIPQAVEITLAGEAIEIKPLKVGQMPAFMRAIAPVAQQIGGEAIDWLALLGEHGDKLLTAVAIAVGKPRAWVEDLGADEAILLTAKVIEVNADFFTRQVLPKLDGLFAQASAAAAGSTPSNT